MDQTIENPPTKYWKKGLLYGFIAIVVTYIILIGLDFFAYSIHGNTCRGFGFFTPPPAQVCSFPSYLKGFSLTAIFGSIFGIFIAIPLLIITTVIGYIIDSNKKNKI